MTSMEFEKTVTVEGNHIVIKNLQTSEKDIVSYFANLDESENLEEKLLDALKIGVIATKSIGIAGNVNYVEKAFNNLDSTFNQKIDQVFGDNGQFSGLLKNHFGEDGKIIKELFDPNKEGTPLYSLRTDLQKYLWEIREKLGINQATTEIIDRSAQKGFDFEDRCEKKLEWVCSIHSDKLERTSKKSGKLSGSMKGDFVLTLGDIGKKIVFETKDKGRVFLPEIQRELKEAMENREAEYGIFVAKSRDSLPDTVGWFNEYDGNQLVCAIENGEEESMIDGEIIHIAYKWARARLRLNSAKEKKLDPAFIIEKTGEIQKKIADLKKIKTQCKNIKKSSDEIEEITKNTETGIKQDLEDILDSLTKESE